MHRIAALDAVKTRNHNRNELTESERDGANMQVDQRFIRSMQGFESP